MNRKNDNEDLDNLNDEFSDEVKQKYNERQYFLRLTESKTKSIHFVLRKRRGRLSETKKKIFFDFIESIPKSIYLLSSNVLCENNFLTSL